MNIPTVLLVQFVNYGGAEMLKTIMRYYNSVIWFQAITFENFLWRETYLGFI